MAQCPPKTLKQNAFIKFYADPASDSFGNAYKSAVKSGYSHEYAKNILNQGTGIWEKLSEEMRDKYMLEKAEQNIKEAMELDIKNKIFGDRQQKATLFVASRLNKAKWSERLEHTGANGKDLIPAQEVEDRIKNLKDKC